MSLLNPVSPPASPIDTRAVQLENAAKRGRNAIQTTRTAGKNMLKAISDVVDLINGASTKDATAPTPQMIYDAMQEQLVKDGSSAKALTDAGTAQLEFLVTHDSTLTAEAQAIFAKVKPFTSDPTTGAITVT